MWPGHWATQASSPTSLGTGTASAHSDPASSMPPPPTSGHSSPELLPEECETSLCLAKVGPGLRALTPPRHWHLPRYAHHSLQGGLTRHLGPQPPGRAQHVGAQRVKKKPRVGKEHDDVTQHNCHPGVLPTSLGLPELRQGPQNVSTDPRV